MRTRNQLRIAWTWGDRVWGSAFACELGRRGTGVIDTTGLAHNVPDNLANMNQGRFDNVRKSVS